MEGKKRWAIVCVIAAGILSLCACGKKAEEKGKENLELVVSQTMESLKELELERFNECTDNYVSTQRNWIGIPVRKEYRVFNELLQPGFKGGKRYEANYKLAEKIVEHMAWEVKDIRQDGEKAEIDMEISNIDMQKVMGEYEIHLLENMLESEGIGIGQLVKDMADLANGQEDLINLMDTIGTQYVCTMEVTVFAYQNGGQWEIHISDEFINAFMGNMMAEDYPEDLERRINELLKQYEQKMEEWGDEAAETVEKWVSNLGT